MPSSEMGYDFFPGCERENRSPDGDEITKSRWAVSQYHPIKSICAGSIRYGVLRGA